MSRVLSRTLEHHGIAFLNRHAGKPRLIAARGVVGENSAVGLAQVGCGIALVPLSACVILG